MNLDVLFINPGNSTAIYQGLATDYAAIEPPTWALLLAQSMRSVGYQVGILDVNAEQLSEEQAVEVVKQRAPRLACLVVYGQNPNSGTVNMSGAVKLASEMKKGNYSGAICAVGSHISALPKRVLEEESSIDVVLCNEGVYALKNLLAGDVRSETHLAKVKGIGYRDKGTVVLTAPEMVVPQERLELDLPGYAWDLLPFKDEPLDVYRAHFWHARYDHLSRSPFAAIYTSLGCTFKCDFCMINILNRNDNDLVGIASNYAGMRFWSPDFMLNQFDELADLGCTTIRISDEMFLLNKKYFVPLCERLSKRPYSSDLNMWAYSRVDTVRDPSHLELIRRAGIRWLALGIESGEASVRRAVTKGKFGDVDIKDVVKMIEAADIDIIANYLFGLPTDDFQTMENTLQLGIDLCTTAWNGYPVMALPGSELYKQAIDRGDMLPTSYEGYSFYGRETLPLSTETLSPAEVLKFRDEAFVSYHKAPRFRRKLIERCGSVAVSNIDQMLKKELKRNIVDEAS